MDPKTAPSSAAPPELLQDSATMSKWRLRIISHDKVDGIYVYNRTWHVTQWTEPANLASSICKSLGGSNAGDFIFQTVLNREITQIVYLEDVLRVLLTDHSTIWHDIDFEEKLAVLLVTPARNAFESDGQKAIQVKLEAANDVAGSFHARRVSAQKAREANKPLYEIAKFVLQRETTRSHAFLPFWNQQVWCRHLTVRLVAARTGLKPSYVWETLHGWAPGIKALRPKKSC